jgi:hypothetical protein
MNRLVVAVAALAVVTLAGCAGTTAESPAASSNQAPAPVGAPALTASQRDVAAGAQRLADRIAEIYQVPTVSVLLGPASTSVGASIHRSGVMTVTLALLDFPETIRDAYIAHEMAHWILGHVVGATVKVSDLPQREIDADVKAVEILMRAKHLSQTRAFASVYAQQMASKQSLDAGQTTPLASHPDPCRKMAALLAAYPAERAFVDRVKANPRAAVCRP